MDVSDFKQLTIAKLDDLINQRNQIMKSFLVKGPSNVDNTISLK